MKTTLQLYNYYDKVAESISLRYKKEYSEVTDMEFSGSIYIGVYLDEYLIDKKGYRDNIRWRVIDLIEGKRKYKYHSALSE